MPDADSLIQQQPFYLWDTMVQPVEVEEPDLGIPLDSIFKAVDHPEPMLHKSLFTHHGMPMKHTQLQERPVTDAPAWIFVLLLALTVLVFVFHSFRKIKFGELLKATVDHRTMDRMTRECNLIRPPQFIPICLLLSATLGMAVFNAAMSHTGILGYLTITTALALGYLLRNSVLRLLGNVFDNKEAISTYITSNYTYHLVLTTALIPLLFLATYLPWGSDIALYSAFGITALTFLVRVIRSGNLFLTISKSLRFYLFYYLCTVEIVPILILIKWITE